MSETYLKYIHDAIDKVKMVLEEVGMDYTIIVTADHGGHDRVHGLDVPEGITIPIFSIGPDFISGEKVCSITLLVIVPTIADLMGIPVSREWENSSVHRRNM